MVSPPTTPTKPPFTSEANERQKVRVLTSHPDPFAGLKGHDYIKARNLAPMVPMRVQTSAHASDCEVSK